MTRFSLFAFTTLLMFSSCQEEEGKLVGGIDIPYTVGCVQFDLPDLEIIEYQEEYAITNSVDLLISFENRAEAELSNTSVSSKSVSEVWARKIRTILPLVDFIFSSEQYGDYLAEFLQYQHLVYEPERTSYQISASMIRANPHQHRAFIADTAKPYFGSQVK